MEATIISTLEGVVMLDLYPRSEIQIIVHVLESDGYVCNQSYVMRYRVVCN